MECMGNVQRFLTKILAAVSESLVLCVVGSIMEENRVTAKEKNSLFLAHTRRITPRTSMRERVSHVGQHFRVCDSSAHAPRITTVNTRPVCSVYEY
jgi:hypothetical protein